MYVQFFQCQNNLEYILNSKKTTSSNSLTYTDLRQYGAIARVHTGNFCMSAFLLFVFTSAGVGCCYFFSAGFQLGVGVEMEECI